MTVTSLRGIHAPDDLLPGDLFGLQDTADRLRAQGQLYDVIGDDVARACAQVEWHGAAGEQFRSSVTVLPAAYQATAWAHRRVARAVDDHAECLAHARRRADEAIGLWEHGDRLTVQAGLPLPSSRGDVAPRHRGSTDTCPAPHRPTVPDPDPGAALRDEALIIATSAQRQVEESAQAAAAQIRAARNELPQDDPSFWDRVGGAWSDAWHGASDVGAALGNAVLSFGNALMQNPDLVGEILAGLALIQGGIAAEGGGLVLDATGVGAPGGVAVGAAGLAAIVAGAGLVAHGIGRAATEAAGESAVAPLQGAARGGGGGTPTALDAAEVERRALAGTRPGKSKGVRVVKDEHELDSLFDELSVGGVDNTPSTGAYANGGKMVELPDGTSVGLRRKSTSGGSTIDIKFPDDSSLKVHIG